MFKRFDLSLRCISLVLLIMMLAVCGYAQPNAPQAQGSIVTIDNFPYVRLRWNRVAGASSYLVYRADTVSPESWGLPVARVGENVFSFLFTQPEERMEYYYVTAYSDVADAARMVAIPAGSFIMGDRHGWGQRWERPTRVVTLASYHIGKYPVTQKEWTAVMGPSNFAFHWWTSNPAETVSWYAALVYCNRRSIAENLTPAYSIDGSTNPNDWGMIPRDMDVDWDAVECNWNATGYRLPTEAEWEYAARGARNNPDYYFSGGDNLEDVGWYFHNSDFRTHTVGMKQPNNLSIYDMAGNVWEWCWDWFGDYPEEGQVNPRGPEAGMTSVLRGGSWYQVDFCRVSARSRDHRWRTYPDVGLRVVRSRLQ